MHSVIAVFCLSAILNVSCVSQSDESQNQALPIETFFDLFQMCELPCWLGIIPEQTTQIEAESILADNNFEEVVYSEGHRQWETELDSGAEVYVILRTEDDYVTSIDIGLSEKAVTLEAWLREFGEPDTAIIGVFGDEPEQCSDMQIHYHIEGILLWMYPEDEMAGVQHDVYIYSMTVLSLAESMTWYEYDTETLNWAGVRDYCISAAVE